MPSKRAVSSRLSLGLTATGNKKESPGTSTTSRLSTCGTSESKCQASSAQPQPGTGCSQRQDVRVNVCVRVRPLNKLELRTNQIDGTTCMYVWQNVLCGVNVIHQYQHEWVNVNVGCELFPFSFSAWSYENNEIFQTYVPSGDGSSRGKKKKKRQEVS